MKVGLVIPDFLRGRGGAERVAAQVANLIVREGEEACIVCYPSKNTEPPYDLHASIDIHKVDFRLATGLREVAGRGYQLLICFVMDGFFSRAVRIAEAARCPLVIQECTNPNRMAALLATSEADGPHAAFWLRQAVLAHASAIRFTTPGYIKSVVPELRRFAYGFYNSLVVPDIESSVVTRRKIVCVSALKSENKNGLVAVEAFCRMASDLDGWELHHYGRNSFGQRLDEITARYPSVRVVCHGMVDDIRAVYADAYGLVIPSFDEGLPNVVVEAFSFGVPCIGFSDCLGVNELIRHDETGLLADRKKPDALVEALGQLCRDESGRAKMAENARRFAEEHLAYGGWASEWLRLIRNAKAGKDASGNSATPPAFERTARARLWRGMLDACAP